MKMENDEAKGIQPEENQGIREESQEIREEHLKIREEHLNGNSEMGTRAENNNGTQNEVNQDKKPAEGKPTEGTQAAGNEGNPIPTPEQIRGMISDGVDRAKRGEALAVYAEVLPLYDLGLVSTHSHYALGWIIYYALHQSEASAIAERKRLLARYLGLQVPRPHKLHSMILTEAIRLSRDANAGGRPGKETPGQPPRPTFSILGFLKLWGLENLRPGDWRRKEVNGQPVNSTVERLLTQCVDEIVREGMTPPPAIVAILDKALEEYPDSSTLHHKRSILHRIAGNRDKARESMRHALLLAPSKFYLWQNLAELIPVEENRRLHVALLSKGRRTPGQDKFKGRLYLALASALAGGGAYPEALWELGEVKRLADTFGWHLPGDYNRVMESIPEGTTPVDPQKVYARLSHLAEDELYSILPEIEVRKTYHKWPDPTKSRNLGGAVSWRVTDAQNNNYWVQPHRFGLHPEVSDGTVMRARVFNGRVVKLILPDL